MVKWFSYLLTAALLFASPLIRGDTVIVAVPLSIQPYFIPISHKGLAYEAIVAAFETQGIDVQPMLINPRESVHRWEKLLTEERGIDCAAFLSPAQVTGWYAVDDIYSFHDYAITLTARNVEINRMEDLGDKRIIAYLNAKENLGPAYREVVMNNPRYREISNHRAQVKLLARGRTDVIIADKLLTQWYLHYLAGDTGKLIDVTYHNLFTPEKGKFACRTQELVDAFSAGVEAIRANGTLDKIDSSYRH